MHISPKRFFHVDKILSNHRLCLIPRITFSIYFMFLFLIYFLSSQNMLNGAEYDSALSTTVSNHIHKGFILVQWLIFVFAHSKNVRTLLSRENMTLLSTELLVLQVKSRTFSNNQIWFLKCYQQRMCEIHCNVDKHFYSYLNHLCICRIFFLNFMMKVFCSFPDYGEVFIILLSKNQHLFS